MKTFIAKNSWLANSDLRLDASYHLSDGQLTLIAFKKAKIPTEPLNKVTERIFYGGRSKRAYVNKPEYGLPFIKGADIIKADFSNLKIISRKRTAKLNEYFLEEGWTLITRSGTIGNTAYVNKDFIGKAASDDIIRVVPSTIPSGFLYAFLSSKNGKALLTHGTYGAVIQHIEPEHIENIPIPIFSSEKQQQIHDLITEAAELRVEANKMLKEVESLFTKYLNLNQLVANKFQTGSRKITKIRSSFQVRLDAPSFINHGVKLIDSLKKKYSFDLLGNCSAKVSRPGIFKRIYVKTGGFPYIKGSELGLNNPFVNCVRLSKTKTPFLDELELTEDQILITCAGSVGNVRIITKEFQDQKAIGSQDIIRIKCNSELFTSEYIYAYLKLPFIFDFIQSLKYGSVIERVEPFHIDQIPVLIPTKEFSELITREIKFYKNLTYNAFCKENQAVQLVEKEIEQWQH